MEFKELDFSQEHVKHVSVTEYDNYIYIESLVIEDRYRGKGLGTKVIKSVIEYACRQKKPLYGYASKELGGDLEKLKKWYKKLGFNEIQGNLYGGQRYNIEFKK